MRWIVYFFSTTIFSNALNEALTMLCYLIAVEALASNLCSDLVVNALYTQAMRTCVCVCACVSKHSPGPSQPVQRGLASRLGCCCRHIARGMSPLQRPYLCTCAADWSSFFSKKGALESSLPPANLGASAQSALRLHYLAPVAASRSKWVRGNSNIMLCRPSRQMNGCSCGVAWSQSPRHVAHFTMLILPIPGVVVLPGLRLLRLLPWWPHALSVHLGNADVLDLLRLQPCRQA